MGYLTTITFYNDAASELKNHPKELAQLVYDAQLGVQKNSGRDYDPIGSHANPVIIQKPRHADDHTLYLQAGNTVVDVYEAADSKWSVDTFIREMEYHLKRLKEIQKTLDK